MQDRGTIPDIITCNILIDGFCAAGKLEVAQKLFSVLLLTKIPIQVRTYNTMIEGLCKGGKLDEAKALMVRMEANGCVPDDFTYNIVIQAFLHKQEISKVVQYIQMMHDSSQRQILKKFILS